MQYDVIIVGGGLVGVSLAIALQEMPLKIALIEAKLPSENDPRLFALNSSSCQLLRNLNIWEGLLAVAAPIQQVHVSYQSHFGVVRLQAEDVALPSLGHVVPAKHIEAILYHTLLTLPNITLYRPASLQTIQQANGIATLTLLTDEGEKTLQGSLVVGADGTESTLRQQLGIAAQVTDYQQQALVTRVKLKRAHQQIAYERFTADGAIALLPLMGDECGLIWTSNKKEIAALMQLDELDFLAALQQAFGYRLGRFEKITQRYTFPLRMVCAEKAVEGNVILLGNAAHTLHPIAAQGFNLALYEVAVLVEAWAQQIQAQKKISMVDWQTICNKIAKQQALSANMSHHLARLFSSQSAFIKMLLPLGMTGLDVAKPIKKKMLEKILGRTGVVPPLLLSAN